jgi:hypothetical protein
MDRIEHIVYAIVAGSEGFFDSEDRPGLCGTIRIAKEFYDFLVKFGETPDLVKAGLSG